MRTYSITFDVVTPESAEHGDFAETGYIVKDRPIVIDEDCDAITAAVKLIQDNCGHVEASCSTIDRYTSWIQSDGGMDYSTGAETRHNVHLEGYSDAEMVAVAAGLTALGLL